MREILSVDLFGYRLMKDKINSVLAMEHKNEKESSSLSLVNRLIPDTNTTQENIEELYEYIVMIVYRGWLYILDHVLSGSGRKERAMHITF